MVPRQIIQRRPGPYKGQDRAGGHGGCSRFAVRRDHVLRVAAVGLVLYGLLGFALLLLGFSIVQQTFAGIDQLRGSLIGQRDGLVGALRATSTNLSARPRPASTTSTDAGRRPRLVRPGGRAGARHVQDDGRPGRGEPGLGARLPAIRAARPGLRAGQLPDGPARRGPRPDQPLTRPEQRRSCDDQVEHLLGQVRTQVDAVARASTRRRCSACHPTSSRSSSRSTGCCSGSAGRRWSASCLAWRFSTASTAESGPSGPLGWRCRTRSARLGRRRPIDRTRSERAALRRAPGRCPGRERAQTPAPRQSSPSLAVRSC